MASPCVVMGCNNVGNHRFPKDEIRKRSWIRAVIHMKPELTMKNYKFICSAHFKLEDFAVPRTHLIQCNPKKNLKRTAIPSLFPWNPSPERQKQDYQEPTCSLKFDASKLQATYSRVPPIAFAEIQVLSETAFTASMETDIVDDPLSNQETEVIVEDPVSNLEADQQNVLPHPSFYPSMGSPESEEVVVSTQPPPECLNSLKSVQTQTVVVSGQNLKSVETQTQSQSITPGFSVYVFENDDKAIHFYTGLENFQKLKLVFLSLGESAYSLNYFYGPPPESIDQMDQFFITIIILRRHKTFEEMSMLFRVSIKQVYSMFITWIRFMSLQWRQLDLWVDKENVKAYAPHDFYEKYPATRVVLDATECPIKKPKLPLAQQITFSSYKNRNTIKFIIGISPGGLITYVSPSYGGSTSDRQIIERSSILDRFDYNDEIMVDKGLNIQDILIPYGVKVNMPAFFKKGNQISSTTLSSNRKVSSKRVHIERVIGMLKTYRILKEPMNLTEIKLSSDIVFVIAMLVNFRSNIINKNA